MSYVSCGSFVSVGGLCKAVDSVGGIALFSCCVNVARLCGERPVCYGGDSGSESVSCVCAFNCGVDVAVFHAECILHVVADEGEVFVFTLCGENILSGFIRGCRSCCGVAYRIAVSVLFHEVGGIDSVNVVVNAFKRVCVS